MYVMGYKKMCSKRKILLFNKKRTSFLQFGCAKLYQLRSLIQNEHAINLICAGKANLDAQPSKNLVTQNESLMSNLDQGYDYDYFEKDEENDKKLFGKQKYSYYYNFYGGLILDWRVYICLNDMWKKILHNEFRTSYFIDLNNYCFGAYFSRKMIPCKKSLVFQCLNIIKSEDDFNKLRFIFFVDDLTKKSKKYQGFGMCNGKSYNVQVTSFMENFIKYYLFLTAQKSFCLKSHDQFDVFGYFFEKFGILILPKNFALSQHPKICREMIRHWTTFHFNLCTILKEKCPTVQFFFDEKILTSDVAKIFLLKKFDVGNCVTFNTQNFLAKLGSIVNNF